MDRLDRYRLAARQVLLKRVDSRVTVSGDATVGLLNVDGRASLGEGAYVEAQVWVTAAEAAAIAGGDGNGQ